MLADMGGLSLDVLEELAIGDILLGEHSLEALMVGRVELRLTLLLVSGERSLSLAGGDDDNRQDDRALLAANVLKEIKAAAEGLVGGIEDLLERDASEGNEVVFVALPVENLNKESVLGLRVEVGDGQGLLPGHVLAGVGDGLGPLEVGIEFGAEGDTGVRVVLAEALDILETLSLVDGDLEFGGHGVGFRAEE